MPGTPTQIGWYPAEQGIEWHWDGHAWTDARSLPLTGRQARGAKIQRVGEMIGLVGSLIGTLVMLMILLAIVGFIMYAILS